MESRILPPAVQLLEEVARVPGRQNLNTAKRDVATAVARAWGFGVGPKRSRRELFKARGPTPNTSPSGAACSACVLVTIQWPVNSCRSRRSSLLPTVLTRVSICASIALVPG